MFFPPSSIYAFENHVSVQQMYVMRTMEACIMKYIAKIYTSMVRNHDICNHLTCTCQAILHGPLRNGVEGRLKMVEKQMVCDRYHQIYTTYSQWAGRRQGWTIFLARWKANKKV